MTILSEKEKRFSFSAHFDSSSGSPDIVNDANAIIFPQLPPGPKMIITIVIGVRKRAPQQRLRCVIMGALQKKRKVKNDISAPRGWKDLQQKPQLIGRKERESSKSPQQKNSNSYNTLTFFLHFLSEAISSPFHPESNISHNSLIHIRRRRERLPSSFFPFPPAAFPILLPLSFFFAKVGMKKKGRRGKGAFRKSK